MNYEMYVFQPQITEPFIEVLSMVQEIIAAVGQFFTAAHAHEIGRKAAALFRHMGNDVSPEIRRGRVTMEEDDGIPCAFVDIGHQARADA
jgi:hypothetical protein